MSRLFVGTQELQFFTSITKELMQRVVAQKIIYYAVSEKYTKSHQLYDEAIKKTVYNPVEVNALVLYKNPEQTNTQFSIDTVYQTEIYFYINELKERNLIPREGDYLKFGNIIYEIEKLTRPQITFGQIENEVMVKAECRVSRRGNFDIDDNLVGV
jgi:hypothetical protein